MKTIHRISGWVMLSFLILSFLIVAGRASAQTKTLKLPVYGSAGQLWLDERGTLQGFRLKVLSELNNRLKKDNIELKYIVTEQKQIPIKRAMMEIVKGEYDAYFGLIYSKAREDEGLRFSKVEIYSIPTVIWMRRKDRFEYAGLGSLKGKTIGLVNGYPFFDDLKNPDFKIDRSAVNDEANIRKLANGRVDAIIDNITRTGTEIVRLQLADQITYAEQPFEVSRFLIAYNRDVPDEVVNKIDVALKGMHESGVIKRILDEAVYISLRR